MLVLAFCVSLLLQAGVSENICTNSAKMDLQIIVDSSGSVGKENFHTMMKKISESLISQFEIGQDKTRVALFKYSKTKVMRNEFSLNTFSDKKKLQAKLEATKFEEGWTMTAMAMEEALKLFKQQQRKNEETARVCVIFTDGEASRPDDVPAASKLWADEGITVFAVGIGKGISHDGLKAIAGADDRAMEVENFAAIGEVAKPLLKKVCKPIGLDGWVNLSGRFLKYFATKMTFSDANAVCGKLGGVIVYDDYPPVRAYLAKKGGLQWIGATDAGHEGKWTWTDGTSVEKGNWHPGEPNNCCGGQNCAVINVFKPGVWDDQSCATRLPFHCQVLCPPGYACGVSRHDFKVHPEKKTWKDAAKTCQLEGGELVKVDDQAVNAWLANQDPKLGVLWIGATDEGHEGKYTWTDGSPAALATWWPGEPNNVGGSQNCAVVNFIKPGKWDDQGCNVKNAFVCQVM